MKRALIIILFVAILALAGYFGYTQYQQAQAASLSLYQTASLKLGNLTATVGATGTVRANQTTTVYWQTTGRIGKLPVKEGQVVTIGQVLAELDSSSLPQNLIQARADLVTAQRNLENLKNSTLSKAQAQLALVDAQKALKDAQDNRYRKELGRATQASIDQVQADLVIAKDNLERAKENYDKFANKPEDDVMRANAFSRLAQAQQKVEQLQWNLNWLLGLPDNLEVAQADAAVVVAQSKVDDAKREWERLKNGPDPQDVAAAQARVDAIQAILALTTLKAPITGTLTDVKSMVGDQVSSGTVSFRIDDLSHLLVDVSITEVDVNRVKVGQPARLTFDAISSKEYNGKVIDVSPFGVNTSGVVNFTVTVELDDADEQVKPGMTAAVTITIQQLTNVLLVPNRAVRLLNGERVVYLLENGQPKAVPISIGASSDTNSQILGTTVKEGDEVVLNPPTVFTSPSGGMSFSMGGAR